ncbi:hypothetical protein Tco_0060662 [Tanacetum coccineum]
MNDPDITMEEYIQLETEKALRRGQVYNWETATYGMIRDISDRGPMKGGINEVWQSQYDVSWNIDTAYRLPVHIQF